MKLQALNLDVGVVVGAPIKITSADPEWVKAHESGLIPAPLFKIYEATGYLSFGAAPKFLADPNNVLFAYFGMSLRSVRQQLAESSLLLADLRTAHAHIYDPIKKAKGLPWDNGADQRAKRAFRHLVVTACSTLDVLADLIALFFTGRIDGLTLGRAQFQSIEAWLRKPAATSGAIVTPYDDYLSQLRSKLLPLVLSTGPERDWLPLVRLLRNKGAHLGDDVFRYFGLFGPDEQLYLFVPREWPYFFEKYMKPAGHSGPKTPLPEILKKTLIHEDYISFAAGLNKKVMRVVDGAAEVILAASVAFRDFPLNQGALDELGGNSRSYQFDYFAD